MSELSGSEPKPGSITCYPMQFSERLFGENGLGMDLFRLVGSSVLVEVEISPIVNTPSEEQKPILGIPETADIRQFTTLSLHPNLEPPIDLLLRPYVEFRQTVQGRMLEIAIDRPTDRVSSIKMFEVATEKRTKGREAIPDRFIEDFPGFGVRALNLRSPSRNVSEDAELFTESSVNIIATLVNEYIGLAKHGLFNLRFPPLDQ